MADLRTSYLPAIDGLRAFAVGAVLLFHSDHLSGGFLGVDAFFVVSGFLITRQMLLEVDRTDRVSLREFWSRRARRLLPALVLVLVVVIGIAYRFGLASERFKIRSDAPWALGFALNWHHIGASSDYWTSFSSPSPLTHLWSLAVEEQFYLAWPLITVLLVWRRRNRERSVLIGSAIGAVMSFVLMAIVFEPGASTRAYEGTDTRIGALLVGAICATTIVGARAERVMGALGRWRAVVVTVPAVVLAWMWLRVDGRDSWLYRGGFALHAVMFSALLLGVSSLVGSTYISRVLILRPVRWFGQLSYGLYLWHWPIYIALDPARVHLSRWPLTTLRLVVTVAAATLSFYLVERPIRYGLQRKPVVRTALMSVGGITVVALVIALVPLPESRPTPINLATLTPPIAEADNSSSDPTTDVAATVPATSATTDTATTTATAGVAGTTDTTDANDTTDTTDAADTVVDSATTDPEVGTTTSQVVTVTSPATPPPAKPELHNVLWLGDSVAFTTSLGVVAAMGAVGVDVVDRSFPGVGLLNSTGPEYFTQIGQQLDDQQTDLIVFETSTWDEPYGVDAIYTALVRLRDLATAHGAHLLLLPVPPLTAENDDNGFVNDRSAAERLGADDPSNVTFIDTTVFWGTTFRYDLDGDHVPERLSDGVHLCPSGSARFAIWLIGQLQARYSNLSVADPATWATGDWTLDIRYSRVDGGCALLP